MQKLPLQIIINLPRINNFQRDPRKNTKNAFADNYKSGVFSFGLEGEAC